MSYDPTVSRLVQMREKYLGKKITDSLSPAGNWLELTLEEAEAGAVTLSLTLKKDMTNPYGHIHGGMMSLLIDESIGWAVVSLDSPNHYTSLNLNVDFLYAAAEGEKLYSKSRIIRQGKKIIHAECEVFNAKGTLLAKSASNLVVTGMQIVAPSPGRH